MYNRIVLIPFWYLVLSDEFKLRISGKLHCENSRRNSNLVNCEVIMRLLGLFLEFCSLSSPKNLEVDDEVDLTKVDCVVRMTGVIFNP